MAVVAEVKKHLARNVDVKCVKCGNIGIALEKSIWRCGFCGQANAVLAPGPTVHPKTLDEQRAKRKAKPQKEQFRRNSQMMLYGEQGS